MYVTDSLFYLQHLVGGNEEDDNRQMMGLKHAEILNLISNKPTKEESAKDIQDRIIAKSKLLAGE